LVEKEEIIEDNSFCGTQYEQWLPFLQLISDLQSSLTALFSSFVASFTTLLVCSKLCLFLAPLNWGLITRSWQRVAHQKKKFKGARKIFTLYSRERFLTFCNTSNTSFNQPPTMPCVQKLIIVR